MHATLKGDERNPVDETGLCLLSLDGGGVRGLSTLFVLKSIMDLLNSTRKPGSLHVKPCHVFDLIGGTSTGGIIAIMLGRLEMDVDDCITAYVRLMKRVFNEKSSWWSSVSLKGDIKSQFKSSDLKAAILDVLAEHGADEQTLFNDGNERRCKVFVCATSKATSGITRIRSYSFPEASNTPATICDAALATSAATSFFDPVLIGARTFVDGALGANNPVDHVEGEASNIWCPDADLKPLVKIFISIGTGNPITKGVNVNALKIHQTLIGIATDTESTERKFIERWAGHFSNDRYFRFNVQQGLQNVGLEEYKQQDLIESATEEYIEHMDCKVRKRKCVENLAQKQKKTPLNFAKAQTKYLEDILIRIPFRHNIPFLVNKRFVDREKELDKLESLLFSNNPFSKVAIYGLGGVGKTQIALALAHRTYSERDGYAVFWIEATNIESVQKAYVEIAGELKLPGADDKNADAKTLLKDYLSRRTGKWLLIFDNADDSEMWLERSSEDANSCSLKDFLPKSEHGRILFTTRNREIAFDNAEGVIEVKELDEKKAKELLYRHFDSSHSTSDRPLQNEKDILLLLRQLAFLPLAIVQAASFMNKNSMDVLRYRKLLDRPEQEVVDLLSKNFEADGRYRGLKNPVITTWLVSFEYICKEPLSLQYLCFAACIEPKDIPESLLPPTESEVDKYDAIGTLLAYSFMTRNAKNNSLSMHRLVHIATRNWLRKQKPPSELSLRKSFSSAFGTLGDKFPRGQHADRQKWRAYMPHALSLLQAGETQEMRERYQLLYQVATCLWKDGRNKQALRLLEQLVTWTKDTQDQDDPSRLESQNLLAVVYKADGQLKPALELLENAVKIQDEASAGKFASHIPPQEQTCNRSQPDALNTRISRMEKCRFAITELVRATIDPYRLAFQHSLAVVYGANGDTKRALGILQYIVEVEELLFKGNPYHPILLRSQQSLAVLWKTVGQTDRALKLLTHVVEARSITLAKDHPSRMSSQTQLASVYKASKNVPRALEILQPLVDFQEKTLAADDRMRLTSQHTLASVYKANKDLERASKLLEHIVEVEERTLPEDDLSRLASQHALANVYKERKQLELALKHMDHVVVIKKKALAKDHPSLLRSQHQLAIIFCMNQQFKRAVEILQQVVGQKKQSLSEENPVLLASQHALAVAYFKDEQVERAQKLQHHVVAVQQRLHAKDHPSRMASERVLSEFYKRIKRTDVCERNLLLQKTMDTVYETS